MAKYRSSTNFASAYGSNHQGYAVGVENFVFLTKEVTPGTFVPGAIGTQGSSTSGSTPSVDISAGTDTSLKIAVDGGTAVTASVVVTGLTSGVLIAAAFETAMNLALAAAGQDARVWMDYSASVYHVYSQKTGTASSVVITAADSLDLTTELKLGVTAGGTEAVGAFAATNPFLGMTAASVKFTQESEPSKHRSGRQPSGFIKKKKMVEGDIETYLCYKTTGGSPVVDNAVQILLEAIFGRKTVSGTEIKFDNVDPQTVYTSLYQVNNMFARKVNGMYIKNFTLTFPGDGPATVKYSVKARDAKECSYGKLSAAVNASASVILNAGEAYRFEAGALVMCVDADGRTVVAGADGSLSVSSISTGTDTVVLSTTVTVSDDGFLVPWSPQVFGFTYTDEPADGLVGSLSFDGGSTTFEQIKSIEFSVDPKLEDLDNYYGADGNRGFVVGDRTEIKVKVEVNLTADDYRYILQAKQFTSFSVKAVSGEAAGRRCEIVCPKVIMSSPAVELPETGSVTVTFEGIAYQQNGAMDGITISFK